jgi:hypothetical protein
MLSFPKNTYFNKRIPKQKFYDTMKLSSGLEKLFVQEIETIHWVNKLSPDTLNLNAGTNVTEIEIIEIVVKQQSISRAIIDMIDREIPYHLVFVLKYNDNGQIWINFKEDSKNRKSKYKVDSSYKTDWMPYENLSLQINGLDLDRVYENFMIQISDGKLQIDGADDFKEAVMIVKEKETLTTYIESLENKIKNEKQFNRQVALNDELRKAKKELDKMKSNGE